MCLRHKVDDSAVDTFDGRVVTPDGNGIYGDGVQGGVTSACAVALVASANL